MSLLLTADAPVSLVPVPAPPSFTESSGDPRTVPSWPTDPETAYARLIERVHESVDAGDPVPCVGPGAEAWVSDDPDDQVIAAARCGGCLLRDQCAAYALAADELAGVWGGYVPELDRKPKNRPRKTSTYRPTAEARERKNERSRMYRAARKAQAAGRDCGDAYAYVFLGSGAENPRSDQGNGYPTMNTKTTTGATCNCGCGEEKSAKAMYRPGHDSKHVSTLIGHLEHDIADGKKITAREIATLANQLPSARLQAKFVKAAERVAARATAPKPEPKADEEAAK